MKHKQCFSIRLKDQRKLERLILKHGLKSFKSIVKSAILEVT